MWSSTSKGRCCQCRLGWVSFGGKPLYRQVASTSVTASLSLRELARRKLGQCSMVPHRMVSAHWMVPSQRSGPGPWQGLLQLDQNLRNLANSQSWEIHSLCDKPLATPRSVGMLLGNKDCPVGLAVIGGHGEISGEPGVNLASNDGRGYARWCGQAAGPLDDLDLLILVSCSIGRLAQSGYRDVEGFVTDLFAAGARSVIAARWPIAGDERLAKFVTRVVENYLQLLQATGGKPAEMIRARALNMARKQMLDEKGRATLPEHTAFHAVTAFELYGLG